MKCFTCPESLCILCDAEFKNMMGGESAGGLSNTLSNVAQADGMGIERVDDKFDRDLSDNNKPDAVM